MSDERDELVRKLRGHSATWSSQRAAADLIEQQAIEIARLRALVDACAPYLKDGETPAERIERERADNSALLSVMATRTKECEALRAQLAASEAACAQMREALRDCAFSLLYVKNAFPDGTVPGVPRALDTAEAALATDAGKGYVSTEGAVEVNAVHSRYNNPSAFVATNVPYEWAGKRVLIVRKPEDKP